MPELRLPAPELEASFAEAMAEFAAEGRGGPDDGSAIGRDLRAGIWRTNFPSYVDELLADRDPATTRWVPCTTWWWCAGETYLGRIALRHRLTDDLRRRGGHIGYDVRSSARGRGHASAMLAAVLPHAAAVGVDLALVTVDDTNAASRAVVVRNGGVPVGIHGRTVHYAVPTYAISRHQLHA
ncbi:GNAT family N-acetyltransferase [Actinokineospora guangxiensis]|uniref:GNAT family N-acetyltransferase n=1 Tax=Actinokineospora guangxiensis TaxID=1490288 RepID=A0ABW0EQN5_9PSEU